MPPGLLETALPAPQDPDARASADTLLPGHRPPAAATHGRFVPRPPSAPNPRRPVREPPRPATKLCQGKSRLCAQRGPGPSAHSPAICPHRRGPRGPHTAGPDVVVCSSAPPQARAPLHAALREKMRRPQLVTRRTQAADSPSAHTQRHMGPPHLLLPQGQTDRSIRAVYFQLRETPNRSGDLLLPQHLPLSFHHLHCGIVSSALKKITIFPPCSSLSFSLSSQLAPKKKMPSPHCVTLFTSLGIPAAFPPGSCSHSQEPAFDAAKATTPESPRQPPPPLSAVWPSPPPSPPDSVLC